MLQPPEELSPRSRRYLIEKWPELVETAKAHAGRAHNLICHLGAITTHEAMVYSVSDAGEITGQRYVKDWREV